MAYGMPGLQLYSLLVAVKNLLNISEILDDVTERAYGGRHPFIVHTDNGPEFSNGQIKAWATLHGVDKREGPPYYPQAQGQVIIRSDLPTRRLRELIRPSRIVFLA